MHSNRVIGGTEDWDTGDLEGGVQNHLYFSTNSVGI